MMLVIGIDCATKPTKTGLVLASWEDGALRLEEAKVGSARNLPIDVITAWMERAPIVLLALDAPLGWPQRLPTALAEHRAGQVIRDTPNELFMRATDRWIFERLEKRPLEVGASFIARTALCALKLLEKIRQRTGHSIPLVWEASSFSRVGAVEVYPAATRIAREVSKGPTADDGLSSQIQGDLSVLGKNPHVRDAAWCAIAGADFLAGRADAPPDIELARREGWIWVQGRKS